MLSLCYLEAAGFEKVGKWVLEKCEPKLKLEGDIRKASGVYLFVIGAKVYYVGKADELHIRAGSYARTIRLAKRNRKVHDGLEDAIHRGLEVALYVLVRKRKRLIKIRGLPLDFISGLEDGLIADLVPPWNTFNLKGRLKRSELHE